MRVIETAALLVLGLSLPAAAQTAQAATRTYDAVVEGMTCRQQSSGRLDCLYAVGTGLRFTIAGVGQDDALITFARVDSTAGWVAGYSAVHGCVVVKPAGTATDAAAPLAFVSPRDGRVYRAWQHCRQQQRR